MTVGIAYVDGPRLARSLFAAADWVAAGRDEINRINVFPVPDGDTGTNFSLTLRAVADALRALGDASLPDTARTMARGAVLGARGNSGMMLAHFLLGFAEPLGDRPTATTRDVAGGAARRAPTASTRRSTTRGRAPSSPSRARRPPRPPSAPPRTPPTSASSCTGCSTRPRSRSARTPELMAALREAGRGGRRRQGLRPHARGRGPLHRGRSRSSRSTGPTDAGTSDVLVPAAAVEIAVERDFQFCTELLVRGEQLPPANEVRAAMHTFGGSVVVAVMADILKIHVHTDTPEAVFTYAARWGRVETTKADDMRAQHRRLAHAERRTVAVVTDSSADLADGVLDRHHIAVVPLQVVFGDETFRDRIELKPEEFYRRLEAARDLPTTSQPTPADFVRVLRDARSEADEVVGVLLSGSLSGTYASAQAAVRAAGISGDAAGGQPVGIARGGHAGAPGGGAGRGGLAGAGDRGWSSSGCAGSRGCC